MPITQVPAYTPVDTATRLAALETALAQRDFMAQAIQSANQEGPRLVDYATASVYWGGSIFLRPTTFDPTLDPSGYFEIKMPPINTVIPVVGSSVYTSVTVSATGIQLQGWQSLYYIVPIGQTFTSLPGNFRVVADTSTTVGSLAVPYNWFRVATRSGDGSQYAGIIAAIKWFDGLTETGWIPLTFANSWTNYGATYQTGALTKVGNIVYLRGLVAGGSTAAGAAICTLPVGFRPSQAAGVSFLLFAAMANTGVARLDIDVSGNVAWNGAVAGTPNNAFVSLAGISFYAST